jgi:hypothetical protein
LIGGTGNGKSATANNLIGDPNAFPENAGVDPVDIQFKKAIFIIPGTNQKI